MCDLRSCDRHLRRPYISLNAISTLRGIVGTHMPLQFVRKVIWNAVALSIFHIPVSANIKPCCWAHTESIKGLCVIRTEVTFYLSSIFKSNDTLLNAINYLLCLLVLMLESYVTLNHHYIKFTSWNSATELPPTSIPTHYSRIIDVFLTIQLYNYCCKMKRNSTV